MLTLAVMQALLGFTNETHWLRYARKNLIAMFPHLAFQSGYNKRLRKLAATMTWLVADSGAKTSMGKDQVWVVDSTPVECARSRETVKRSELAGWAEYGYCASHSRFFWGLRLHLVCTLHGLPVGWALTGAKADEREVLAALLQTTPTLARGWPGPGAPTGRDRRQGLLRPHVRGRTRRAQGIDLLRKARKGERPRPGQQFFKPLRQVIESVNATFKTQLDIERHRAKTIAGRLHPHRPARPRTHRRHLAQRQPRAHHPTLTDRLRPLRPLGIDSSSPGEACRGRPGSPRMRGLSGPRCGQVGLAGQHLLAPCPLRPTRRRPVRLALG